MKKWGLTLTLFFLLCSCVNIEEKQLDVSTVSEAETTVTTEDTIITSEITLKTKDTDKEKIEEIPEIREVQLLFAGDNLIHTNIGAQAMQRTADGSYDFSYAYANVANFIEAADLAVLNQETLVTDEFPPSNYPRFATPTALGDEMVHIGFDAVSISNNHCLDQGEAGLLSSISYWETMHPEIILYGAYKNDDDMNKTRTLEVNGITFAFLGFMEHTNGLYLGSDATARLIYLYDRENMEQQVKAARNLADCVIVSVHFGVEITNEITAQQYEIAQLLTDWGADIIVGTQPHTIQSMEFLKKADGGNSFVFYCLGNFISSQNVAKSMVGMLGGITVSKTGENGKIMLSDAKAVPVITHYERSYQNVKNYLYWQYNKEIAASHGCEGFSWNYMEALIEANIPGEYLTKKNYFAKNQ